MPASFRNSIDRAIESVTAQRAAEQDGDSLNGVHDLRTGESRSESTDLELMHAHSDKINTQQVTLEQAGTSTSTSKDVQRELHSPSKLEREKRSTTNLDSKVSPPHRQAVADTEVSLSSSSAALLARGRHHSSNSNANFDAKSKTQYEHRYSPYKRPPSSLSFSPMPPPTSSSSCPPFPSNYSKYSNSDSHSLHRNPSTLFHYQKPSTSPEVARSYDSMKQHIVQGGPTVLASTDNHLPVYIPDGITQPKKRAPTPDRFDQYLDEMMDEDEEEQEANSGGYDDDEDEDERGIIVLGKVDVGEVQSLHRVGQSEVTHLKPATSQMFFPGDLTPSPLPAPASNDRHLASDAEGPDLVPQPYSLVLAGSVIDHSESASPPERGPPQAPHIPHCQC